MPVTGLRKEKKRGKPMLNENGTHAAVEHPSATEGGEEGREEKEEKRAAASRLSDPQRGQISSREC